jgi:alkylation response protein AidB-like acyl-CoA dehydrogenase
VARVTDTATHRVVSNTATVDTEIYLQRARSLAPLITSEAATIERDCTVSKAVVDSLIENDLFWCMLPKELGGGGIPLVGALKVVEEISRADGSTGWAYMATSFETAIVAGFINPEAAREYFLGEQRTIVAGQLLPRHPGTKVDGGYQLSGDFSFASGSDFATVVGGGFIQADAEGNPLLDDNGAPQPIIALLPKDKIEFRGNWDVWGLAGTGSYDYRIPDSFVPDKYTMATLSTSPVRPEAVYKLGPLLIGFSGHAGNALGIATRALQEVVTICTGKIRPNYTGPVGESELFRLEFAKAEASLQAARLYVHDVITQAEKAGEVGTVAPEQLARVSQAVAWTQGVAADVVTFAHRWGGSQSIRNDSALGRCMRDSSIATQHLLVDPMTLVNAAEGILPRYHKER